MFSFIFNLIKNISVTTISNYYISMDRVNFSLLILDIIVLQWIYTYFIYTKRLRYIKYFVHVKCIVPSCNRSSLTGFVIKN